MKREKFLANLLSVNWVQERFRKDQLIESKMQMLWMSFCASISESVDAFNDLRRNNSEKAADYVDIGTKEIIAIRSEGTRTCSMRAVWDGKRQRISCSYTNRPALQDVEILFEAVDLTDVVMTVRGEAKTSEELSKLLLETLLFA